MSLPDFLRRCAGLARCVFCGEHVIEVGLLEDFLGIVPHGPCAACARWCD